jgi:biotin carboxyl carrier protein
MPAQVADVLVSAGDGVTIGQPLLILEAMKMEMRVTAPHDGVVTQVFVARGDVVERDQQLIDIRDSEGS